MYKYKDVALEDSKIFKYCSLFLLVERIENNYKPLNHIFPFLVCCFEVKHYQHSIFPSEEFSGKK